MALDTFNNAEKLAAGFEEIELPNTGNLVTRYSLFAKRTG